MDQILSTSCARNLFQNKYRDNLNTTNLFNNTNQSNKECALQNIATYIQTHGKDSSKLNLVKKLWMYFATQDISSITNKIIYHKEEEFIINDLESIESITLARSMEYLCYNNSTMWSTHITCGTMQIIALIYINVFVEEAFKNNKFNVNGCLEWFNSNKPKALKNFNIEYQLQDASKHLKEITILNKQGIKTVKLGKGYKNEIILNKYSDSDSTHSDSMSIEDMDDFKNINIIIPDEYATENNNKYFRIRYQERNFYLKLDLENAYGKATPLKEYHLQKQLHKISINKWHERPINELRNSDNIKVYDRQVLGTNIKIKFIIHKMEEDGNTWYRYEIGKQRDLIHMKNVEIFEEQHGVYTPIIANASGAFKDRLIPIQKTDKQSSKNTFSTFIATKNLQNGSMKETIRREFNNKAQQTIKALIATNNTAIIPQLKNYLRNNIVLDELIYCKPLKNGAWVKSTSRVVDPLNDQNITSINGKQMQSAIATLFVLNNNHIHLEDIKPANMGIDANGHLVFFDLGFAEVGTQYSYSGTSMLFPPLLLSDNIEYVTRKSWKNSLIDTNVKQLYTFCLSILMQTMDAKLENDIADNNDISTPVNRKLYFDKVLNFIEEKIAYINTKQDDATQLMLMKMLYVVSSFMMPKPKNNKWEHSTGVTTEEILEIFFDENNTTGGYKELIEINFSYV